jgi:hypothetical protein
LEEKREKTGVWRDILENGKPGFEVAPDLTTCASSPPGEEELNYRINTVLSEVISSDFFQFPLAGRRGGRG